jgi:hypothetical protein
MSKVRVISDGTPVGTKVFLPDGTEIAEHAYAIDVVMAEGEPARVTLSYSLGPMEIGGQFDPDPEPPQDAIALHNARKL